MAPRPKLRCADCNLDRNFHGEKLRDPRTAAEAQLIDPDLGGVVTEFHTCPGCGSVVERTPS